MPANNRDFAWKSVAWHALWLHGGWEAIQCRLFYDMGGFSLLSAFFFMGGATVADVILSLFLIALNLRLVRLQPLTVAHWLGTLALYGAVAATSLEFLARSFGWWHYTPAMPGFPFFGQTIGLLPVLQIAVLPSLAFLLGRLTCSPKPK